MTTHRPPTEQGQKARHRDRVWGRAKGRPLRGRQAQLMQTLYPKLAIDPERPLAGLEAFEAIELEIGFGGGEHLLTRAARSPGTGFLGVEPFLNGMAKAVCAYGKDDETAALSGNVRFYHGSVFDILDTLPENRLSAVHILYPDPWPKPRHFKRRLVQERAIAAAHRALCTGGTFYFASDIVSYVDWALGRVLRHGGFDWAADAANDWLTPFENWPGTRYEDKAIREGRTPHYLKFTKLPPKT